MERLKKALGLKRAKRWERDQVNPKKKYANGFLVKMTLFFVIAVFSHLTAVWMYYGSHQVLAQGRHFFPLIIPIAFLFVFGLRQIFDMIRPGLGGVAVIGFVVIEFFILNFVIWAQMVPVFHMMIKSPYKGM